MDEQKRDVLKRSCKSNQFASFFMNKKSKNDLCNLERSRVTFNLACKYHKVHENSCFEQNGIANDDIVCMESVLLMNLAFSCELYLKAIYMLYNKPFGTIHDLDDLFDELPNEIEKNTIKSKIKAVRNFDIEIQEVAEAFEYLRYEFEKEPSSKNIVFMREFAVALNDQYVISFGKQIIKNVASIKRDCNACQKKKRCRFLDSIANLEDEMKRKTFYKNGMTL